ncbi:hypothetical protein DRQ18_01450 [bacterium]|nr:MAG: hypothetical protein DRQ18_01450 [bacterium]
MRKLICIYAVVVVSTYARIWQVDTLGAEGDSVQKYVNIAHGSAVTSGYIDTVMLGSGTYHLFINDTVGLIMQDSVVLMGQTGAEGCTLTAVSASGEDTAWHVIFCDYLDTLDCRAVVKGFTIKGGRARGSYPHYYGAGIYCNYSSVVIESCRIVDNHAYYGGGIYICHSSPRVSGNIIEGNSAQWNGGGLYICEYSSPQVINNIIQNDSAIYGGGLYISDESSPQISGNMIRENQAEWGGGFFISYFASPVITNNTVQNNFADWDGGGFHIEYYASPRVIGNIIKGNSADGNGGGFCIRYYSSPEVTGNIIQENLASDYGGGFYIADSSSFQLINNTIYDNSVGYCGGALSIRYHSSVILKNCVFTNNIASYGGVVHDTLYSKVIIDSCFIVDNGSRLDNVSGLAYIAQDADSGVTFKLNSSNVYYNTYQPDTEILNNSGVTLDLTDNFWWYTDSTEISALIYGPSDHAGWHDDFVQGVAGEPVTISSVNNYGNDWVTPVDSIGAPCTLYIEVQGTDQRPDICEAAVAIIRSTKYPAGVAVALMETDTNSGVYRGKVCVIERINTDSIRMDDIYQRIGVDSAGDNIWIVSNADTSKKFLVKYKAGVAGIQEQDLSMYLFRTTPILLSGTGVIPYYCPGMSVVSIKLYDTAGRIVKVLYNGKKRPGYHQVKICTLGLPPGIYLVKFDVYAERGKLDYSRTQKLILLK